MDLSPAIKNKLFIMGGSHAVRLVAAAKRNENIIKTYFIDSYTKSGAKLIDKSFILPYDKLQMYTENDYVIIQIFGNEIMEKHIYIETTGHRKTIHLEKFVPYSQEKIEKSYFKLLQFLTKLKTNIIIIDCPYRHLFCCNKHIHQGLISFQKKQNSRLKQFFKGYKVVNHINIIGLTRTQRRKFKLNLKL